MNTPRIIAAGPDEVAVVAGVIAESFQYLLVAEWLVDEDEQRRAVLEANMLIHVEHAVKHGMVTMTANRAAVSVWFPVGDDHVPPPPDYEARLDLACGRWADRFRALDDTFAAHHPDDEAHHHLAFLAVRPEHQRRGLGSALLRHHHELYPDLPAYLEASSPGSRSLYERHGYHTLGVFDLPDDGPPLWPMWRPRT